MLHVNYRYYNPHVIGKEIESQSDWYSKFVSGRAGIKTPNPVYSFNHTINLYHKVVMVCIGKM